jgi:hypothetical protein
VIGIIQIALSETCGDAVVRPLVVAVVEALKGIVEEGRKEQ